VIGIEVLVKRSMQMPKEGNFRNGAALTTDKI